MSEKIPGIFTDNPGLMNVNVSKNSALGRFFKPGEKIISLWPSRGQSGGKNVFCSDSEMHYNIILQLALSRE